MATVCIDPIEGKFIACGGIDGKLHVFKYMEQSKTGKKGK